MKLIHYQTNVSHNVTSFIKFQLNYKNEQNE